MLVSIMNFLLWVTTAVIRWIRLKIYQYEVTFAVYMLTPTEKFIFSMLPCSELSGHEWLITCSVDSLLLSLVSMIVTGAYIYLPNHIRTVYGHLYYYWVGDRTFLSSSLPSITSVFRESATQKLEVMYDAAKNTATTTTGSIAEL